MFFFYPLSFFLPSHLAKIGGIKFLVPSIAMLHSPPRGFIKVATMKRLLLSLVLLLLVFTGPAFAFSDTELQSFNQERNGVLCFPGSPAITKQRVEPGEMGSLEVRLDQGTVRFIEPCIYNKGPASQAKVSSLTRRAKSSALACSRGDSLLFVVPTIGDVVPVENGPALEFIPEEPLVIGGELFARPGDEVRTFRLPCREGTSMEALKATLPR